MVVKNISENNFFSNLICARLADAVAKHFTRTEIIAVLTDVNKTTKEAERRQIKNPGLPEMKDVFISAKEYGYNDVNEIMDVDSSVLLLNYLYSMTDLIHFKNFIVHLASQKQNKVGLLDDLNEVLLDTNLFIETTTVQSDEDVFSYLDIDYIDGKKVKEKHEADKKTKSQIENKTDKVTIKRFPIKNWENLTIIITGEHEFIFNYEPKFTNVKVEISEIGFESQKDRKETKSFRLLKLFAMCISNNAMLDNYGFLNLENFKNEDYRGQPIKRLSDDLREIFDLKDKPFLNDKRGGYKPKFTLKNNI